MFLAWALGELENFTRDCEIEGRFGGVAASPRGEALGGAVSGASEVRVWLPRALKCLQDYFWFDPALGGFVLSRWRRAVQFLISDLEDLVIPGRCLALFHEKSIELFPIYDEEFSNIVL